MFSLSAHELLLVMNAYVKRKKHMCVLHCITINDRQRCWNMTSPWSLQTSHPIPKLLRCLDFLWSNFSFLRSEQRGKGCRSLAEASHFRWIQPVFFFNFFFPKKNWDLRCPQDMLLMNPLPLPDASSSAGSASSRDLDEQVAQLVGMGFETMSARGDGMAWSTGFFFPARSLFVNKW